MENWSSTVSLRFYYGWEGIYPIYWPLKAMTFAGSRASMILLCKPPQ